MLHSTPSGIIRVGIRTNPAALLRIEVHEAVRLLRGTGLKLEDETFEKNLGLRTENGRHNVLTQLLADDSHIPIRVAAFSGETKADKLCSAREFDNLSKRSSRACEGVLPRRPGWRDRENGLAAFAYCCGRRQPLWRRCAHQGQRRCLGGVHLPLRRRRPLQAHCSNPDGDSHSFRERFCTQALPFVSMTKQTRYSRPNRRSRHRTSSRQSGRLVYILPNLVRSSTAAVQASQSQYFSPCSLRSICSARIWSAASLPNISTAGP